MISLTINGAVRETDADHKMPLLYFLRDYLNLTGTKFGCGIGSCGACTVLVDGVAFRSCTLPLENLEGANIVTIEGIGDTEWKVLSQAWIDKQVPQCGYCQSGMIMASIGLLQATPRPSAEQIRAQLTNLCRCGTYQRIEEAVLQAAENLDHARAEAREAAQEAAKRAKQRVRDARRRK